MMDKRKMQARANQLRKIAADKWAPAIDRVSAKREVATIEKLLAAADREVYYTRIAPQVAQGPEFIRWMNTKFTTEWRIAAHKTANLAALYETIPPWRLKRLQISYVKYRAKHKLPLTPGLKL